MQHPRRVNNFITRLREPEMPSSPISLQVFRLVRAVGPSKSYRAPVHRKLQLLINSPEAKHQISCRKTFAYFS
ncbi:hypothetical protein SK128_005529 [Halocaridina rubra]|uniref:Uncharacterized protein n=1 Tax=Halocaridina rubra TaxID=373956 RepID=A0AAN8ZVB2_HALRR